MQQRTSFPDTSRTACFAGLAIGLLLLGCASSGSAPDPEPGAPTSQTPPAASVEVEAPAPEPTPEPVSTSPATAYLDDEEALSQGQNMFRAVCTGYCHSTEAAAREAPDLFDCEWIHGNTDDDLFRVIADGVPDTTMLPFKGKLADDLIWRVIAYVRKNSPACG